MPMTARHSHLLLIDFQERLMPVIQNIDAVVANANILLKAAQTLDIPILTSEQYPKGLGPTSSELRQHLTTERIIEKMTFSAYREKAFRDILDAEKLDNRYQLIISGIESHVCVLQTAVDCLEAGYEVYIVGDAVSSRTAASVNAAKARLIGAGAKWVTSEMVVFEWLEKAGTPEFKALSALIK